MSRVALVTGGTKGIGAAIALALKEEKYKVAVCYHGDEKAATDMNRHKGIHVYKIDVSDFQQCSEGISKIANELGPIDVVVNNAGITRDGMFHKMTLTQW